ncbi:MAG: hypothetical protein LBF43_04425 [Puniceicoccales bacterium]|nr:hypothetical protein [Puniceicoccales bacterium]
MLPPTTKHLGTFQFSVTFKTLADASARIPIAHVHNRLSFFYARTFPLA